MNSIRIYGLYQKASYNSGDVAWKAASWSYNVSKAAWEALSMDEKAALWLKQVEAHYPGLQVLAWGEEDDPGFPMLVDADGGPLTPEESIRKAYDVLKQHSAYKIWWRNYTSLQTLAGVPKGPQNMPKKKPSFTIAQEWFERQTSDPAGAIRLADETMKAVRDMSRGEG